jgi:ABC-type uncharacterized transport system ATPase subunit
MPKVIVCLEAPTSSRLARLLVGVSMRLETIDVQNFRSCYDTRVSLADHLTLLVGENDAGKSSLIDAIRLSVPPVSGRNLSRPLRQMIRISSVRPCGSWDY